VCDLISAHTSFPLIENYLFVEFVFQNDDFTRFVRHQQNGSKISLTPIGASFLHRLGSHFPDVTTPSCKPLKVVFRHRHQRKIPLAALLPPPSSLHVTGPSFFACFFYSPDLLEKPRLRHSYCNYIPPHLCHAYLSWKICIW